jgi:hypothetical protein
MLAARVKPSLSKLIQTASLPEKIWKEDLEKDGVDGETSRATVWC